MEVPEFLWHCSRDSEVIGSDILEVLLSLSLCRRNAPNYRQNDGLLETCFSGKNLIVGNSLRYFNNIWRKSLVAKANMKIFGICVWIWICVSNMYLNNNSWICLLIISYEINITLLSNFYFQPILGGYKKGTLARNKLIFVASSSFLDFCELTCLNKC